MKSLFHYKSFRKYLHDIYLYEKNNSRGVNLTTFARALGLSGPAFQMITVGSRNLTMVHIHGISRALKMAPRERDYFEALVLKDQASNAEIRAYYQKRLSNLVQDGPVARVRTSDRRVLADWRIPALLIHLLDVGKVRSIEDFKKMDLNKLKGQFKLSNEKMAAIEEVLSQPDFFDLTFESGYHMVFEKLGNKSSQKHFFRDVTTEMLQRLETHFDYFDTTLFRAFTLSIRQSQIQGLREELIQVFEKYMQDVDDKNETDRSVFHGVVGLFPVIEIRKK